MKIKIGLGWINKYPDGTQGFGGFMHQWCPHCRRKSQVTFIANVNPDKTMPDELNEKGKKKADFYLWSSGVRKIENNKEQYPNTENQE